MSNQDDITQAWHTFQSLLDELRSIPTEDMGLPDARAQVRHLLDDAYTALTRIETELDELGQELEAQHQRLGTAMEPYSVDVSTEEEQES